MRPSPFNKSSGADKPPSRMAAMSKLAEASDVSAASHMHIRRIFPPSNHVPPSESLNCVG